MKSIACLLCVFALAATSTAADFAILRLDTSGHLSWTNAFPAGVVSVETRSSLDGPWLPRENYFTSNSVGGARVAVTPGNGFVRLLSADISTNSPRHYTNLLESFGILETVAGKGQFSGDLYICDRNANRVYRMDTNGVLNTIAGNGTQTGGGEGFPALQTGLILPRSIWFIPNGGYFITEHDPGNRIWYVDPAGIIHRWMNGSSSANTFGIGDGQWFDANPSMAKASRIRAINTDPNGNLIFTESNNGYVRRIRFNRLTP